ncbi:MAG: DUF898 family protein [Gammaproteobacteria bacterium]|jgi:uncharacterized membrane protein YjgN (DUF898 family)|nr:DUF898 family protein [Gammaproteobacteria bacterium]
MNNPENLPSQPISYDGQLGQQYKIFILNIFLGLITLGIYHYWGKTRQRRYTTSSFSVFNDRFEYTGYGGQLFWGMIKAVIIIGILSIPFFYAISELEPINQKIEQFEKEQKETKTTSPVSVSRVENVKDEKSSFDTLTENEKTTLIGAVGIIGFYIIFYYAYLPFVAVFGSLRYRITHSRWRGIRGHMKGSSILYGFVGFFHTILKVLTLGLWIPFADGMTWKYKMNRIYFGNQQASFNPQYGKLFKSHILTLLIMLVILGVMIAVTAIVVPSSTTDVENLEDVKKLTVAITYIIGILVLYIPRFWYRACLIRMKYNNLTFGNIGFICTISGWALFKQLFGNALIKIFTLGLGSPIVTQRRMHFFCNHVTMTGDIAKTNILQATGEKDKAGEGLSSMIDMNIGLF